MAPSDSYVSPLGSYQGWSEPTVQDWQETHRQVTEESGHAGHQGMTMPGNMPNMPDQSIDNSKPVRQPSPKPDMPKMNHEGMDMPGMSHDHMPPKRTPNGGKH